RRSRPSTPAPPPPPPLREPAEVRTGCRNEPSAATCANLVSTPPHLPPDPLAAQDLGNGGIAFRTAFFETPRRSPLIARRNLSRHLEAGSSRVWPGQSDRRERAPERQLRPRGTPALRALPRPHRALRQEPGGVQRGVSLFLVPDMDLSAGLRRGA